MSDQSKRACEGAETIPVRTTEHMEQCQACGNSVRADLVDHGFFGFNALGCGEKRKPKEKLVPLAHGPYDEVYYQGLKWLDENG